MIGKTLDSYRIVEQIGMGGMATVYKAYDPGTDRYVAVKILPKHFSQDPKFQERFRREAKAIAKLEHIHILPIFAYGEAEGIAYMAMRYLPTGTLTDRIEQGALPLDEAGHLLNQIASALDHAHVHGVLHRDVKPSNVLLDAHGNAFLTDFGIAKMVESTLDLTGGGILGTPAYMSPEQCRGSKELTPASDLYSLGIVLYEMVTGRAPFQAETPIALIHMQLADPLPLPRQLRPDLPEEAERVIFKALSKEPDSRYQTCGAMAAAFAGATAQVAGQQPQPAEDDLTIASGPLSATTVPAVDEATALHEVAEVLPEAVEVLPEAAEVLPEAAEETVITPPLWRRIPAWALGLIGVLVIVGLIAIVVGLLSFGKETSTSEMGDEAGPPVTVAAEAEAEEATPAPVAETEEEEAAPAPGAEAEEEAEEAVPAPETEAEAEEAVPASPISPGEPSTEVVEVRPCSWDGLGLGMCIFQPEGGRPNRILEETEFQFSAVGSWSPDGQQIAFSAVGPGDSMDYDSKIYIVNADGAGLTKLPAIGNDIAPAWSPDGEWLVFHSSGNLAVMRPDGSDPDLLRRAQGNECSFDNPQWSPDNQWIVVSMMDISTMEKCEDWLFPMVREVQVISHDGDAVNTVAVITHENEECLWIETVFSPDGTQVAYFDGQCRPWIVNADGSGQATPLEDFPYWWTSMAYPQWGQAAPPMAESEFFYDDFEGEDLDPGRWKLKGDMDWEVAFLEGGRLVIEFENELSGPWDGWLEAKTPAPVRSIEFNIALEEAEGDNIGFGIEFIDSTTGQRRRVFLNERGDILIGKETDFREISKARHPLPVQYNIWLNWEDGQMVIYADDEPIHKVDMPDFAERVAFWLHLEPGEEAVGYIGDVRLAYAEEGDVFAPITPEESKGKIVDWCEGSEPPQICIYNAETGRVIQMTDSLDFGELGLMAWSPDGQKIVFNAGSDFELTKQSDHKLYLINVDGSGLRQLTKGNANDISPAWSPDGKWIAFHRDCELWIIHPNGSEAQMLLAELPGFCVAMMAWSPDGQQIAFLNVTDNETVFPEVWLINRDGTDPHPLHSVEWATDQWGDVFWRPNGRQIAFRFQDGSRERIFLINADGSGEAKEIDELPPSWSPNFWPQWGGKGR